MRAINIRFILGMVGCGILLASALGFGDTHHSSVSVRKLPQPGVTKGPVRSTTSSG